MADNVVMTYLNAICKNEYSTKHAFFGQHKSFEIAESETSIESLSSLGTPELLPVSQVLKLIQDQSLAMTSAELKIAVDFFTPIVLHQWELSRLLDVLRCQIKDDLTKLDKAVPVEKSALAHQVQDNIQAALVLTTLLKVVTDHCGSAPWVSKQQRYDLQQAEYCALLQQYYDIDLKGVLDDSTHKNRAAAQFVATLDQTVPGANWLSVVYWIDFIHGDYSVNGNPGRLFLSRLRRLGAVMIPLLNNAVYQRAFTTLDVFVLRGIMAYVNWVFFIPRLTINLGLLVYHLVDHAGLTPLERSLDKTTRLRMQAMRFWSEFVNDGFFLVAGLVSCFYFGGVSPLALTMAMQIFDMLLILIRAGIETHLMIKMEKDWMQIDTMALLGKNLQRRMVFEKGALGYAVLHFGVLLLCLSMTLPSMAAISTLLPVVGAFVSLGMTVVTRLVNEYKIDQPRRTIYRPRVLKDEVIIEENNEEMGESQSLLGGKLHLN